MKKKKNPTLAVLFLFSGVSEKYDRVAEAIGKTYRASRKRRSQSGSARCHFAWECRGENRRCPISFTRSLYVL